MAAAAAMAAATNKFLRKQSHHQLQNEEKVTSIVSLGSPNTQGYTSTQEASNEVVKNAPLARTSTATPSLESCGGDEPACLSKNTPMDANGSMSNDIDSNCSTVNSND